MLLEKRHCYVLQKNTNLPLLSAALQLDPRQPLPDAKQMIQLWTTAHHL